MIDEALLLSRWQANCLSRLNDEMVSSDKAASRDAAKLITSSRVLHWALISKREPDEADLQSFASDIGKKARGDQMSLLTLQSMLKDCQLALIDVWLEYATENADEADSPETERLLRQALSRTGQLSEACCCEFVRDPETQRPPVKSPARSRTLQHEIRTPLQGALLTSELLLEDVSNGVDVSLDDVRSIRQSIETAVKVLNDFAKT